VLGAGGGVGLAAVELGKAMGARVVAAASSADKLALARAHGADESVLYPTGALDKAGARTLTDAFKAACGPDGAAVIYDPVGGDYCEAALRAIGWEGRYLVVGFPAGIPRLPLNLPLLKGCQLVGVFWGEWMAREREEARRASRRLVDMLRTGQIDPLISRSLPLAAGAAAIRELGQRASVGKIVLTV